MNIKFYLVSLWTLVIFFLGIVVANGQTTNPLVCCQFRASDGGNNTYDYCSMVESCDYNSIDPIKANGTKIVDSSINQQIGSCYDDYDTEIEAGKLGTICKSSSNSNNNTSSSCGEGSSLSDCIASKMPNKNGGVGSNKSTTGLIDGVSTVVNTVLGLLGLIFTAVIIYAGIQWIHYGGESEGKKKASKRLKNAVIGLAITLSAYSITSLIINNLK